MTAEAAATEEKAVKASSCASNCNSSDHLENLIPTMCCVKHESATHSFPDLNEVTEISVLLQKGYVYCPPFGKDDKNDSGISVTYACMEFVPPEMELYKGVGDHEH